MDYFEKGGYKKYWFGGTVWAIFESFGKKSFFEK